MHGELVLLAGAVTSAVAGGIAILVRRPLAVTERLATLARRLRE